LAMTP